MKPILILFALLSVGNSKDVPKTSLKFNSYAVIRQLFEIIKYNIKNGHSERDLPVLDPFNFNINTFEMVLPHKALSLQSDFKNGEFKGLANFQLEDVEFIRDDIAMDLLINFPLLTFTSEYYKIKGDIYQVIPIEGEGKFDMEVHNYKFRSRVYLMQSIDQKSVLIRNFSHPQFNMEQIVAYIFKLGLLARESKPKGYELPVDLESNHSRSDFDKNIDNVINAIIDDLLANYLTRFNQYVSHICADDVIDLLNYFLNKLDTWTIFAVLLW